MLTDEMRADGWLPHDGGPCPVPLDSCVTIMIRDGTITKWPRAGAVIWKYGTTIWEAGDCSLPRLAEVIAYKLETPDA
jgi:hypothetical protein